MLKPTPFYLHFILRHDKKTTYRQFSARLRVGKEKPIIYCVGVHADISQWKAYKHRDFMADDFEPNVEIENKLWAVYQRHVQIFQHQLKRSKAEGWTVTANTIRREFRGLPPVIVIPPIAPCRLTWKVISRYRSTPKQATRHA